MININEDIRVRINKKKYKLIKLSKYCEKKKYYLKTYIIVKNIQIRKVSKKNQKKSNVYIIYK